MNTVSEQINRSIEPTGNTLHELTITEVDQVSGAGLWAEPALGFGLAGIGFGALALAGGPFTIPLGVAAGVAGGLSATTSYLDTFSYQ